MCKNGNVHNGSLVFPTITKAVRLFKRFGGKYSVKLSVKDVYFLSLTKSKCSLDTQINCAVDKAYILKAFAINCALKIYGKDAVKGVNNMTTNNPLRYGNGRGCNRYDTDENPVRMRIHIQSLRLEIDMSYCQMAEHFEVKCKPLVCDRRCHCGPAVFIF